MDDIFKFYGFDWIGMVATFASLWLLGEKKWHGFIFGALASIAWVIFSLLAGSWGSLLANIVFFFLNLINLWKWRN
jgi:nicotinamide riboside transporter PnuC